jgi:hypothetical protein
MTSITTPFSSEPVGERPQQNWYTHVTGVANSEPVGFLGNGRGNGSNHFFFCEILS